MDGKHQLDWSGSKLFWLLAVGRQKQNFKDFENESSFVTFKSKIIRRKKK
jgi:hypothetical protein